jgi:prephenate dehydrogenase
MKRVAVLGLGLIGGSLLRRLGERGIGYDRTPATRTAAARDGYAVAHTVVDALREADTVVLAVPLPALPGLLDQIARHADAGTLLTDVTSVKSPVLALVRERAPALAYVGGHPMAGTEASGWDAGNADLFAGAAWVACLEPDTDLAAWVRLARGVTGWGCRVVPCAAAAHDQAVARISHLPHLLAAALAAGAVDGPGGQLALALAAGSFRDGTRVAATRPELTAAMCAGNAAALGAELDALVAALAEVRPLLADPDKLAGWLAPGHDARQRRMAQLKAGPVPELLRGSLTDPEPLRRALLALGGAGGHVASVITQGDRVTLACVR